MCFGGSEYLKPAPDKGIWNYLSGLQSEVNENTFTYQVNKPTKLTNGGGNNIVSTLWDRVCTPSKFS